MNPHPPSQIGFGGGCHWCTEAIFQSLRGVSHVAQGWIASNPPNDTFSEAVLVDYDPATISLDVLVSIHLHTHSSTSNHSMRAKYRSAVYTLEETSAAQASAAIDTAQPDFNHPLVTQVLPFNTFRLNNEKYLNYYASNTNKPFCQTYITPKLETLMREFSSVFQSKPRQ